MLFYTSDRAELSLKPNAIALNVSELENYW